MWWSWEAECSLCLCPQLKKQSEVFVARVPGPGPSTGSQQAAGPQLVRELSCPKMSVSVQSDGYEVCMWWRLVKIINSNRGFVFYKFCVNFSKLHEERRLGYY